jgi:archaellum component FlaC
MKRKNKRTTLLLLATLTLLGIFQEPAYSQAPVTDVGAGIQREALWTQEKEILSKINWYNVLIKALNGDIKGLTGELLGIDQKMLESLEKVSGLIKDYKRVQQTRDLLSKIMEIYTEKVPKLVQDENFTAQQAAVIVQSFDLILDDSRQLTNTVLNTILTSSDMIPSTRFMKMYAAITGPSAISTTNCFTLLT